MGFGRWNSEPAFRHSIIKAVLVVLSYQNNRLKPPFIPQVPEDAWTSLPGYNALSGL
jgi:hypothetical protein